MLNSDSLVVSFEKRDEKTNYSNTLLVIEQLRDFLRKSNSESTRRVYKTTLEQFQDFLRSRNKVILEAKPSDLLSYRDGLLSGPKPLKPASVNLKLAAVRSFYGYLQLAGLVSINPADTRLVTPPALPESSSTSALSTKEIRILLASPDKRTVVGARDYVILFMLARLALRAAEICSIKVRDIVRTSTKDIKGREIKWVLKVKVKGGRERLLPIPVDVKNAIDHYLRMDTEARNLSKGNNLESALIQRLGMGRTLGGESITTRALWNIVRKYGDYAGIKKLHPHMFRHTAITRALDMGLSYRDVQMMSGHRSIETVQRYDSHRYDMARNAINELNYDEE